MSFQPKVKILTSILNDTMKTTLKFKTQPSNPVLQLGETHEPNSSTLQLLPWVSPLKASIIIIIKACLLCNSFAMHHYQSLIKASQNPFKYPILLHIVSHDQNYLEHWSLDPKVFVGSRAFRGLVADIPREKKKEKKRKRKAKEDNVISLV